MDLYNLVSFIGIFILLGVAWLLSTARWRVNVRTVVAGVAIQLVFAVFVFLVPAGTRVFMFFSQCVIKALQAAQAGTLFCFGPLADGSVGYILVFQYLPTIVFFTALIELLYFVGFMPLMLKGFSRVFTKLMRVSGAESLCAASNIFVGIESAATVRPYLERMTPSELCTILATGLATIASSVLGLYVGLMHESFPNIAGHLISASLLSAPAAIVMAKIIMPETDAPETLGISVEPHYDRDRNFLEAIIHGATNGGKLVMGIIVLLLAFLGFVALVNIGLEELGQFLGQHISIKISLQLQDIFAFVFYPFTLIIGVPRADAWEVARLLGERIIMTEVPAYQHLRLLIDSNALSHPRSAVLASYALCGFAHVASLAIFIGGISALAPRCTRTLTKVALRALVAATLACLLTAAVAGVFYGSGGLLLGPQ